MQRIGAAILVAGFLTIVSYPAQAAAQVVLDCDYFNFQEQAQAILEEDDSDPNFLDEDGDGIACPDLPSAGPDPEFPELPESGRYRCVDFPYQEMAQEIYDEDPSDPNNLDPTEDAVACSRLPLLADYQDVGDLTGDDGFDDGDLDDEFFDDESFEDDFFEDDAGTDGGTSAETDDAAVDTGDGSANPLTEEEREARRAARRAERQAEREAAAEAEDDDTEDE